MVPTPATALGAVLAAVAAAGFAFQFVFVRLGTEDGDVTDVVFVTLACNVLLIVPAAAVVSPGWIGARSAVAFAAAGLSGSLFARLCMFAGIRRLGASRTSPIVASNVLFATLLAVVFLDESLVALHGAGILLVVAGVAYISYESAAGPDGTVGDADRTAFLLPVLAALFIGVEPILIAVGFDGGSSVLPGLAISVTAAFVGFSAYLLVDGRLPAPTLVREPSFRWHLGAGAATTVAFLAYFAALETAPVVLAVPIVQTTPLLVVAISAVALPTRLERVTWRLVAAAAVVVVGATAVSLSG